MTKFSVDTFIRLHGETPAHFKQRQRVGRAVLAQLAQLNRLEKEWIKLHSQHQHQHRESGKPRAKGSRA